MTTKGSHVLLVAGVVSHDYLVHPTPCANGASSRLSGNNSEISQLTVRAGAAHLVAQLLSAAAPQWGFDVLGPQSQSSESNPRKDVASSVIDLGGGPVTTSSKNSSLRVIRKQDIAQPSFWHAPHIDQADLSKGSTVIICGSPDAFHDVEPELDFLQRVKPRYIIHHMTRPLATGPLWDIIRNGPLTRDGIPELDHLAVIIDADDLRAEGISLSRSLSWEKTAEDFVRNLGSNGRLDTLVTCPNLIVRFGNEGVIHHRGRDATNPKLYFRPREVECDNGAAQASHMIGLTAAFTAGFALGFADSTPPNVQKGIQLGLSASREMETQGFVSKPGDSDPDYPIDATINALSDSKNVPVASIPSSHISSRDGESWSIFESIAGDPVEVAREIVISGPAKPLSRYPSQTFGELLSIDRKEHESLRSIVDIAHERLQSDLRQPTSFGVMGLPGSGKKFVAANLARHFASTANVKILNFNAKLIQQSDLPSLCHNIRDHTAQGLVTVVIFENFEAVFDSGSSQLLNNFLVLMRDGSFTDRGHIHAIGHPLLFFLVNQNLTLDISQTPITRESREKSSFNETQLLDYLHGVVHISGPNQTSPQDKVYPVRRALMLRNLLTKRFPHLVKAGNIKINDAVLHSLLLVPSYKHGLRSLDKIISTSRLSNRDQFDVSALPPEEQIQSHVDGKIFMGYLRSPKLPAALREKIAQSLFEVYKEKRRRIARTEAEQKALENDPSMKTWPGLSPELKESTRCQADDIPRKLRAVNCFMLDQERGEPLVQVKEFTVEELDMLSEMEHERFNAERLQRQWKMGERASDKRTTPFIIPWRDLTQDWKDVDRVMVECVPRSLEALGWKIYRLPREE